MKVFPIKVEPAVERHTNIVEWMIGNVCNFNCSFCSDDFKTGTKRFFELSKYTDIIDKLIIESGDKKIWFKITGGEPTLYPHLIELMTYIKSKGHFTYLITNGSRTLRYWQELRDAECMDIIALTHHSEQTSDVEHMIDVVTLFEDTPTIVSVNVTCVQSYFYQSIRAYSKIYENCAAYINLQQVNDNLGMSKYSEEQQKILLSHSQSATRNFSRKAKSNIDPKYAYHTGAMKFTYSDNSIKIDQAINFIKRGEDNFNGYKCDIGITNIRIEHDSVQRAVCNAGEKWSIFDEKLFQTEPIICPYTTCSCTLDLIIPKNINR